MIVQCSSCGDKMSRTKKIPVMRCWDCKQLARAEANKRWLAAHPRYERMRYLARKRGKKI